MNDKQKKCLWVGMALIVVMAVVSVYVWPSHDQRERPLPFAEQAKVTSTKDADLVESVTRLREGFGLFDGTIYNGSSWTITRVIFSVTAKEQNGSFRWQRDFSENIMVSQSCSARRLR